MESELCNFVTRGCDGKPQIFLNHEDFNNHIARNSMILEQLNSQNK